MDTRRRPAARKGAVTRAAALAACLVGCSDAAPDLTARMHDETHDTTTTTAGEDVTADALRPPLSLEALAALNRGCEDCHAEQSKQWRASMHRVAFSDNAFAHAYARTPFRFCRDCHAPLGDGRRWPEAWAAENGVACVTCHLDPKTHGDAVLAAPGIDDPRMPHAVVRTEAMSDERACATCHEFSFPTTTTAAPAGLMQRTLWEHEQSPFAHLDCGACHMPEQGEADARRHDHTFAITHDPDRLRRSIVVVATRRDAETVELSLTPVAVGHAFPTGDLFRRIELLVERRDRHGAPIESTRRYLARHFPPRQRGKPLPREVELEPDDRLTGPARFELRVDGAREHETLHWRVAWQRVDHRVADEPEASTLHGEVVLAQGTVRGR